MKKIKIKKSVIAIIVVIAVLTGIGIWFANAIFSNPISDRIVNNKMHEYVEEKYGQFDPEIDNFFYDFKSSDYRANVKLNDGYNTEFDIAFGQKGDFGYDNYGFVSFYRVVAEFEKTTPERIESELGGIAADGSVNIQVTSKLHDIYDRITIDSVKEMHKIPFSFNLSFEVNGQADEETALTAAREAYNTLAKNYRIENYTVKVIDENGETFIKAFTPGEISSR